MQGMVEITLWMGARRPGVFIPPVPGIPTLGAVRVRAEFDGGNSMQKPVFLGIVILLILAMAGCKSQENAQEANPPYPLHRPTLTPEAAPLTATVNASPEDGRLELSAWEKAGWQVSDDLASYPLDLDCTLYRIPGTHPQQWVGRCWGNIEALLALPHEVLAIVVQNPRGDVVRLYSTP